VIIPTSQYPGQTATDANYPQGKARNVTVSGDGTGTPLEQKWINDWFGFQQAVALAAGITPSNTPDNANVSQVLQGLQTLFGPSYTQVPLTGGALATGATAVLGTLAPNVGGFAISANAVAVPAAGDYLVTLTGEVTATVATTVNVFLQVGGVTFQELSPQCTGSLAGLFAFEVIASIATPSTQKVSVAVTFSGGSSAFLTGGTLIVRRLDR
jgi:hypothetical protein